MQNKGLSYAVCLMVLCCFMIGCGDKTALVDTPDKVSVEVEKLSPDNPLNFEMFFAYSWWDTKYKWDDSNLISKWFIDNLGVNVNITTPGGNADEKLNIMIASKSLPDVIMLDRSMQYKKMLENNMLVQLDGYIDKYPNYKNAVDETALKLIRHNDKTYALLNGSFKSDYISGSGGWILNEKIYKQMGEPKLETLEDLYSYLKLVKSNEVSVEGKEVIPLQGTSGPYGLNGLWTAQGEGRYPADLSRAGLSFRPNNDGQLTHVINDDKFPNFIKLFNKYYNEGLVGADCLIEQSGQITEKLDIGRVSVYYGYDADSKMNNLNRQFASFDNDTRYIYMKPLFVEGIDPNTINIAQNSVLGWNNVVISKNAKEPERIFAFFDWLSTDEGQRILTFGPKGEMYDQLDNDGYPLLKDGKTLTLQLDEYNKLPLEKFMFLRISDYTEKAKYAVNKRLPENQQDYMVNAKGDIIINHTANFTEFTDLAIPEAGTDEAIIATEVEKVFKDGMSKIIVEPDSTKIDQMILDLKAEIYKKGYEKVEQQANLKWAENKKILGIN